jgi:hypothetical protein
MAKAAFPFPAEAGASVAKMAVEAGSLPSGKLAERGSLAGAAIVFPAFLAAGAAVDSAVEVLDPAELCLTISDLSLSSNLSPVAVF